MPTTTPNHYQPHPRATPRKSRNQRCYSAREPFARATPRSAPNPAEKSPPPESDDDIIPRHKEPTFLPPRDDLKKRYTRDSIRQEDRKDYLDTIFDPDLE